MVRGDVLGLLCADYPGLRTIVAPLTSSSAIESSGIASSVIRIKIGSPFVIARMKQAQESGKADVSAFAKGRDFAAWLGLVPRQITTGDKPRLTGISKRGSTYMRVLLIHGARAALPYLARMDTQLGA